MTNQQVANIYATTRYNAGISQEAMAFELGVSRRTIRNWEAGISQPNIIQSAQWFKFLGLSPVPFLLRFHHDIFNHLNAKSSDEDINSALLSIIQALPISQKRALLYLFYGVHGSDPESVLQMLIANLHTPMKDRVSVASAIINNFDIGESTNTLLDTDHIMPNMDLLKKACENGKEAASKGKKSYSI